MHKKFLSTPSARRATWLLYRSMIFLWISIHALREEGDAYTMEIFGGNRISIHALREEGDVGAGYHSDVEVISIHALREEGDLACRVRVSSTENISIHALREEGDLDGLAQLVPDGLFLSTPSARRATW